MNYKIYRSVFIVSVVALCILNAEATTYTFIGSQTGELNNYTNADNWENSNYPTTRIEESDTVYINAPCRVDTVGLFLSGRLVVNDSMYVGIYIDISTSGVLEIMYDLYMSVSGSGLVIGGADLYSSLECSGCTIKPGGDDEVGRMYIEFLTISDNGKIIIDVDENASSNEDRNDFVRGNIGNVEGELIINYVNSTRPTQICTNYGIFYYQAPSFNFNNVKVQGAQGLGAVTTTYSSVSVFQLGEGDRALNFDGRDDYASLDKPLGEVRSIEFRFTPSRSGPTEPGQMLFHINDELLQYIIINSTTSAFSNETLTIKNQAGVGANSLYTTYEFIPRKTYHVSIVANSSGTYDKIYIDGVLVQSLAGSSLPPIYTLDQLIIGKRDDAFYYEGKMDEVRLWSDIRTPQEINDNAAGYLDPIDTSGLLLYYKFDQGIPYEENSCLRFIEDEVSAEVAQLQVFALQGSVSNWVHAGCRVMNIIDDSGMVWGDQGSWSLRVVPDDQCHDVLINFNLESDLIVPDGTDAKCITIEIETARDFIVEPGGTLEVKGN